MKDLGKPTALVAAAYFALLQLVLIFPPLRAIGFLPVVAFERLPTVWQVVLGTLIFSTLAFILSVMGQSFPGDVPTLQAALAVKDGAPLVYSLYEDRPETPTPDPSATATITPTSTSTPFIAPLTSSGHVGLEIPTERIASGSAIAREGVLSLVIVPKVVTGSEDTVSSAPPLFNGCAAFVHFLDKNRHVTEKPDDAETVVVWLSASRLPEATAALTHAERVYLVPDVSCGPLQTPFPTPIHTPSPTPPSG